MKPERDRAASRILLIVLLLISSLANAQESVNQQTNAFSLKWYQINTPYFKILYPAGFDKEAQRMANTLDRIHDPEAASMGVRPKKIPLILQNQSSISNAFVTLAPRRSEFYTMPSQNYNFTGNNDWLNLLASHEYRHVVQFQRSLTGFNKFFYYIFGEQAVAGFANAAVPEWFWEGDAVATETAFTHAGRGRIPNFNLLFRTNFLEGRTFNYHKQYLRSYRNNIPNHYVLGYNMVSWLRKKTGDEHIWERIARRAWSVPFVPFTFSNAIKKETGSYVVDLYREMASDLTKQWEKDLSTLRITPFEKVNSRTNTTYTDYLYPQVMKDGTIVAQKSGLSHIEQLVTFKEGDEKKLYVQGFVNETGMMSAENSRVVWNEYRYDPRWQVRTYSTVKGFDAATGSARVLARKKRYAGASLSPDGNSVVTIETGTDYQTRMLILDYATRKILKSFPNPANDFISMPRWTADGKSIIALNTSKAGKTISSFDVETLQRKDLIERGNENLGYPVPFGKFVLYNSPYSNIDNIYALDTRTGKRFQITSSRYGAYNPVVAEDGKAIYYNDQSRNGMDVVKIPVDTSAWKPLAEVKIGSNLYQHLAAQENRSGLFDSVPAKVYDARRYHKASGMINVNSWGPYFNNSFAQAKVGIYSQDVLSTTTINGGYQYDINEKTGSWQGGVSYQGFYPIIDFQILSGNRTQKNTIGGNSIKLDWKETGTSIGLRVPLVFTHSKYYSQFEIGNSLSYTKVSSFRNTVRNGDSLVSISDDRFVPVNVLVNNVVTPLSYVLTDRINNGSLLSNNFSVSYIHSLKTSQRDFNPKFGQYLYFNFNTTPGSSTLYGRQWLARGIFLFPGLIRHHSLFLRTGYQYTYAGIDPNTYTYRNLLFKPRGFGYPADKTFYTASANYQFPVWYPDIALGPVLNIQRIKANFFYDYGQGNHTNYFFDFAGAKYYYSAPVISTYRSAGIEVTFDVNIMRFLPQIELGFRVTRVNGNQYNNTGTVFEFLLGNIPF